jgi:hypothetical protein
MLHVLILTKVFFQKQECPKKGHAHADFGPFWAVLGLFGPVWAVLGRFGPFWGRFMSRFLQKLFPENKNATKRDMPHPIRRRLHPLKTANHLFWKQGCPKKGHASAPIGADCTP